jgi:predicted TIM-barrel fold metal-dependent hydrolase
VHWAQQLVRSACFPVAIVGLVDFLSSELEQTLDVYESCQNVTAVRQHLGWDPLRSNRRFAKRDDLLRDRKWQIGLGRLRGRPFHCSLEVFSPQLGDLSPIFEAHADIGFTIAVMGWPSSSSPETFREWRRDLGKLAVYPNVRIIISALECVFGMNWVVQDAQAWVDTVFETFGIQRTMFGSHSPIAKLAANFRSPWDSYLGLTSALTAEERGAVLHANAHDWFFSPIRRS